MPWFDIVVFAIVAVSALVGFSRGAVREVVTAFAFTLAAIVSIFGLRWTGPIGRQLIDPDWAGAVAAVAIVFIVIYATLRITGGGLARRVQDIQVLLNLNDRSQSIRKIKVLYQPSTSKVIVISVFWLFLEKRVAQMVSAFHLFQ